jgi:integrase
MGCIYKRGTRLWIRFKGPDGRWTQQKTSHLVGSEAKARKLLMEVEAKIEAGAEFADAGSGPITVARYAKKWIGDREGLGLADWAGDAARLKNHVLPSIGNLRLDEVRPRHLVEMVRTLRGSAKLAPKTIYNIYSTLKALFRDAKIGDLLIGDSPTILTKYQLGENVDKDPEWRGTARYTRDELEILISDERIPIDRRVFYAFEGIGGLRLGEVAGLRFRHHDAGLSPLGGILVATSYDTGRTKTKQPRRMPVHPTLAAILAEWRLSGWVEMMGRQPTLDDLIVPMPPEHATRRREGRTLEGMRSKTYCFKRFRDDLKMLGFRHRRGHDLRRTMISLSREDGARKDLLELCTHNPKKKGSSIDVYTTFPWEAFCGEVQKLVVRRRAADNVVEMRATAVASAGPVGGELPCSEGGPRWEIPMVSRELATSLATSAVDSEGIHDLKLWRRRESKLKRPKPETRDGTRPWPVSPRRWLGIFETGGVGWRRGDRGRAAW